MKWPGVVELLVGHVEEDAEIIAILGGEPRIYPSDDSHAGEIPSIAYTVINDGEDENLDWVDIQWDAFGTEEQVVELEQLLRARVASRAPQVIGGTALWMDLLDDGRTHDSPEPGTAHRSFDVRNSTAYTAS